MPLRRTVFAKDNFYHVFSRGNRKQVIFTEKRDYQRFLEKIEEYRQKYKVDVVAYCLLPNHFHLILKQLTKIPLSKFLASLLSSHSHYFSLKHHLPPGHFFQGRFGARLLESEGDLLNTSRYIHLNPVKEKILSLDLTLKEDRSFRHSQLARELRTYPWSSYSGYLNPKQDGPVRLDTQPILSLQKNPSAYRRFVESRITDLDAFALEKF